MEMMAEKSCLSKRQPAAQARRKSFLVIAFVIAVLFPTILANSININVHTSQPTSAPFVAAAASAAAAAALGLDNLGGLNINNKIQTVIAPSNNIPAPAITPAPQVTVTKTIGSKLEHKHTNKKISVTDQLHKFDLYVDPICEQLNKLTEKQLNKIYAQLRQYSHLVSKSQV